MYTLTRLETCTTHTYTIIYSTRILILRLLNRIDNSFYFSKPQNFDHFDANFSLLLQKGCVCELDSGNNGDSR